MISYHDALVWSISYAIGFSIISLAFAGFTFGLLFFLYHFRHHTIAEKALFRMQLRQLHRDWRSNRRNVLFELQEDEPPSDVKFTSNGVVARSVFRRFVQLIDLLDCLKWKG